MDIIEKLIQQEKLKEATPVQPCKCCKETDVKYWKKTPDKSKFYCDLCGSPSVNVYTTEDQFFARCSMCDPNRG